MLRVVRQLPAETIHADVRRQPARFAHLRVAVIPHEQDVAPVQKGQIAAALPLFVRHRAQRRDRHVEASALPVSDIGLRRRAVDRERHFIDPRVDETPRLRVTQRKTVGARVEIDVGKLRLDVFTHLDGAPVKERFAVIEEVDSHERRARFIDDAGEEIEVEHARLARARDPGLGRATRLAAGDVAGRGALDVHARRQGPRVERSLGRTVAFLERQLERTVAAEGGAAAIQIPAQRGDRRSAPDIGHRRRTCVAEHAPPIRVRAAAHDPAVAEHDERAPRPCAREAGREEVQRHPGRLTW